MTLATRINVAILVAIAAGTAWVVWTDHRPLAFPRIVIPRSAR